MSKISQSVEKKKNFLINCAYVGTLIAIILITVKFFLWWILPFVIGYLIAALVQPTVYLLRRRLHMGRRVAGLVAVLFFIAFFGAVLALLIAKAAASLGDVIGALPDLILNFANSLEHLSGSVTGYIKSLPSDLSQKLVLWSRQISGDLTKFSALTDGAFSFASGLIRQVPGLLFNIIVTIVSACFMSMDYGEIRGFVLRQLPLRYQDGLCELKRFFFQTVAKLIRAYLVLMLITFTELCIGLTLMKIPHSITISALIAIVDILPVLGTGTVVIPWAVIELVLGNFYLAFCLTVLYAIITVVRNILEPKIVGSHIGLYPLITLMSMFIGLKAMGAAGMFVLPILVIILKHLNDAGKIRLWK